MAFLKLSFILYQIEEAVVFEQMIFFTLFVNGYLKVFNLRFLGRMKLYFPFILQLLLHLTLILHLFLNLHFSKIFSNLYVSSIHLHFIAFISALQNLHPFFIFVFWLVIQLLMLLSPSGLLNHLLIFSKFYFIIFHHLFFKILNCYLCPINHHHFIFVVYFRRLTFQ